MIIANQSITTLSIAGELGISSKTVKRRIKEMPEIKYIGSGNNGHWEIDEK